MDKVFLRVLNMSLSGSVVIAAVLALRLLLRSAPKKWSYLLWSVVGFRLCCPVSLSSVFSIFRIAAIRPAAVQSAGQAGSMSYIPAAFDQTAQIQGSPASPQLQETFNALLPATESAAGADPARIWITAGLGLWCAGMGVLLLWCAVSYFRMKRRLTGAVRVPNDETQDRIYETDCVRSPFILGLIRPRIYLPLGLEEETLRYVLAHERYHLRRRDHLIKAFAFLLLTVHWFNPLVWLAFSLMNKDMEMSCDEKVLAAEGSAAKAYSASLLRFAAGSRLPMPGPLAFGESGVKSRIRNVLRWKKPKLWVTAAAAALCLLAAAACGTNPAEPSEHAAPDGSSPDAPVITMDAPTQSSGLPAKSTEPAGSSVPATKSAPVSAAERMASIRMEDIQFQSAGGWCEAIPKEELAAALNRASGHETARSDQENSSDMGFWTITIYLSGGPGGYGPTDEQLTLYAAFSENVVVAQYLDGKGNSSLACFEDAQLYWLIRNQFYYDPGEFDAEAYAKYAPILEAKAQERIERSDDYGDERFSGYEPLAFSLEDTFSDPSDGTEYRVYSWTPAFTAEDLSRVLWVGGMWVDREGRILGADTNTWFVVRTGAGTEEEYRFLGRWLYDEGADPTARRENAWLQIREAFDPPEG